MQYEPRTSSSDHRMAGRANEFIIGVVPAWSTYSYAFGPW